jgi:ABC-2 type transport system ATP-binding protein
MSEPEIRIDRLCKKWHKAQGSSQRGARRVSFECRAGRFSDVAGTQWRGKSTLINILATGGKSAAVPRCGASDIDDHPRNAMVDRVVLRRFLRLFFTPREALRFRLYGIPGGADHRRAAGCWHLTDKAPMPAPVGREETPIAGGQGDGYRRRSCARRAYRRWDIELRQQLIMCAGSTAGVTVVLTTHYLEEAEQLCDRIAIINHGRLIANEPTRELIAKAQDKAVVVEVDRDLNVAPDAACFERID